MPLIALDCKITGNTPKGISRKLPGIYKAMMQSVALAWHDTLLDRHFTPGNQSRYGYENRNKVYLEEIKKKAGVGQGKYVSDVLKGQSARWLRTFFSITATQRQATLRMTAPTYFTSPFIGSFADPKTGKLKHVTRQPNKPEEVTQLNNDDRASLNKFAQENITSRVELALRGMKP